MAFAQLACHLPIDDGYKAAKAAAELKPDGTSEVESRRWGTARTFQQRTYGEGKVMQDDKGEVYGRDILFRNAGEWRLSAKGSQIG
jgi:hypothetical protein